MASHARVGIFLGTGLFACLLLLCVALTIHSADSTPPNATEMTDPESGPLVPRNFQEQQDLVQQAIDLTRREAEAAVKRNADTLATRLDLIEQALAQQRRRELEAMQSANRTTLIVAGILAGTGLLGMFGLSFFVMRATHRLTEMTMAVVPLSHAFRPGAPRIPLTLGEGHLAEADPAKRAGSRLLDAIEQLENRLQDLEHTTQLPPMASATPHSQGVSSAKPGHSAEDDRLRPGEQDSQADQNPAVDSDHASRVALLLAKGQTLLNLDQPAEALACCDEVIALEPHNAEAYIKKGAALEKLRREDEAVECYDRAIAMDSSLTTAYLHKGGVFNRLERYEEALVCYEQALKTEQKTLVS